MSRSAVSAGKTGKPVPLAALLSQRYGYRFETRYFWLIFYVFGKSNKILPTLYKGCVISPDWEQYPQGVKK